MTTRTTLRWVVGTCAIALLGPAASRADTLTEWTVPFADSQPFNVVAGNGDLFYVNNSGDQHVGQLDVDRNRITEWPLGQPAVSPGDIAWRASNRNVFVTGSTLGVINQFDPASGILRRWPVAGPELGPWSLVVDAQGGVFFSSVDAPAGRLVIGRLDTTAGTITSWSVPDSIASNTFGKLALRPDGSLFFNIEFPDYGVGIFDPVTGVFTKWTVTAQPTYEVAADPAGNVYFQEFYPLYNSIARLVPSTGALTEWVTPGTFNDDMTFAFGRVFFGSMFPNGLAALDPSQPGTDSVLGPVLSEAVVPASVAVTPTSTVLRSRHKNVRPRAREIARNTEGAFTEWPFDVPRMVSAGRAAIYFSNLGTSAIGRITP